MQRFILTNAQWAKVEPHCLGKLSDPGRSGRNIGYSWRWYDPKVLALTDGLGNLVLFHLMPGQCFATVGVAPLIDDIEFGALLADKAFDSNAIVANLSERSAQVVISQHPRRSRSLSIDHGMCKWWHLIENSFRKLR